MFAKLKLGKVNNAEPHIDELSNKVVMWSISGLPFFLSTTKSKTRIKQNYSFTKAWRSI